MKKENKINNESFPFEDDFDEDDFGGLFDEVDEYDSIYKPSSSTRRKRKSPINTFITDARTESIWTSSTSTFNNIYNV